MANHLTTLARRLLSRATRRQIKRYTLWPPVGLVRWGHLRRLAPISPDWGYSRGLPVDRYYIEAFLSKHAPDVGGRVLEIKDNVYTLRYGGERVSRSDVLHRAEGNPEATIVADLACADELPSDVFDCIICTQTLQLIYDVRAAVVTMHRMLRPGGVLLVTVPGIAKISRYDMEHWGDYWRFTSLSARLLFEQVFTTENVAVQAFGNSLSATAFLQGIAAGELRKEELDFIDPDYEMLIAVRAEAPKPIR